jgi:predicted metal-dependent hydrolase
MRRLLQLTLDLFSRDVPAPPAPVAPRGVAPKRPRRASASPVIEPDLWTPAEPAMPLVGRATDAHQPSLSLAHALEPVSYRHPQANRQAHLDGVPVAYAFGRSKRRTIGFSVGAEGLAVSAPRWVPLHEIDRAVEEKADWILRKLQETRQRHQQVEASRIVWRDGARLPFLGQSLTVLLDPGHHFVAGQELQGEVGHQCLRLSLPHSASTEQIRDAAQAWLMRRAREVFEQRLNHFAARLGVQWTRLSLSSAATRWGSATAEGSIRLHWRLIHFSPEVIDYVVAHELSHLRVMDHSPRFWDTVRSVIPDYVRLRQQLKAQPLAGW